MQRICSDFVVSNSGNGTCREQTYINSPVYKCLYKQTENHNFKQFTAKSNSACYQFHILNIDTHTAALPSEFHSIISN